MPQSRFGTRVRFVVKEYDRLLDSCDISAPEWNAIANDIMINYDNYDSFVVIHGTDTMCYTASILSFMLENLRKTVVLTGI